MEPLAGKILGAFERANYLVDNLRFSSSYLSVLDILIVGVLFYWVYVFLKETRAIRILYGFVLLAGLFALGSLLHLVLLNWILRSLATMLAVAVPVVFQPELRTVLERVGRSRFIGDRVFGKNGSDALNEVVNAVRKLSEQRIGALIVVQRQTGLREYIENGVELDAKISTPTLLSIFFPRSPMHDGAVILAGDRILSARCTLPVSDAYLNADIGMRHKAGVGITEGSDAVSVIVSEETGAISVAVGGKLERRISEERLRNRLLGLSRSVKR